MFCDSQGAIHLTKHQVFHKKSKHIDMRLHFIREILFGGSMMVNKISTEENPIDVTIKALLGDKYKNYLNLVGVQRS